MEHALGALEQKVIAMESLNEREQTMYDSMIEVAAKIEFLQNALDDMIKKGRLTKGEQSEIVEDLQLKLEDIGLMVNEGRTKRVSQNAWRCLRRRRNWRKRRLIPCSPNHRSCTQFRTSANSQT